MVSSRAKSAVFLAVAASALALAAHHAADYVLFHQHMVNLGIDGDTMCDSACADRVMGDDYYRGGYERGYACVEVGPDSYVCRPPRGADDLRKDGYQTVQVARPNGPYGEIFIVPADGTGRGVYHVGTVLLADESLDKIRVSFHEYGTDGYGGVVHVAEMAPGDTYVECEPYRQNVFHLVEYTGTFDMNGTEMAEFWALHVWPRPPELSPCDAEKVISRSLQIDYDIELPDYEEFGRVFQMKSGR